MANGSEMPAEGALRSITSDTFACPDGPGLSRIIPPNVANGERSIANAPGSLGERKLAVRPTVSSKGVAEAPLAPDWKSNATVSAQLVQGRAQIASVSQAAAEM